MEQADLPAVSKVHLDSWRRSYAGLLPDAFLEAPVAEEMARRWAKLPAPHDVALVAEAEGDILGFALVYATDAEGPLLESLHVRADQQGQGIGLRLVGHVARDLIARGYDRIWLEVISGNGKAREVYARWGGVESWPFKDIIAGQQVTAVKVRWSSLAPLAKLV